MIARTWRGRTTPGNADAYFRFVTNHVFPSLRAIDGHRGAYVLRRDAPGGVEFLVMTFWDSLQAIRKFAGEQAETAVVEPQARALLTDFDRTVEHYEIVHDSLAPK